MNVTVTAPVRTFQLLRQCVKCAGEGQRITGSFTEDERPGYVVCRECAEKEGWDFTDDAERE